MQQKLVRFVWNLMTYEQQSKSVINGIFDIDVQNITNFMNV